MIFFKLIAILARFFAGSSEYFPIDRNQPFTLPGKIFKKIQVRQRARFPIRFVFKIKKHLVVVNSIFHTSRNPKRFGYNRRLTGWLEPAEIGKKFTQKQKKWCQYFVTDKILAVVKLLTIRRVAFCSRL